MKSKIKKKQVNPGENNNESIEFVQFGRESIALPPRDNYPRPFIIQPPADDDNPYLKKSKKVRAQKKARRKPAGEYEIAEELVIEPETPDNNRGNGKF